MELDESFSINTLLTLLQSYTNCTLKESSSLSLSELKTSLHSVKAAVRYDTLATQFKQGNTFLHRVTKDGNVDI